MCRCLEIPGARPSLGSFAPVEDRVLTLIAAASDIASSIAEALELRASSFRVDIPGRRPTGDGVEFRQRLMRTRFAVAFGNQTLDDGGEARVESVSRAFNSPFWPFVLISTSIGQEGLDFHLWCHAVVHWNLPSNPVDLEQREGRVHRYKGHAIRRNVASTFGPDMHARTILAGVDPWSELFTMAASEATDRRGDGPRLGVPPRTGEDRTTCAGHAIQLRCSSVAAAAQVARRLSPRVRPAPPAGTGRVSRC